MPETDNLTIHKNPEGTLTAFVVNPRSTNIETLRSLIRSSTDPKRVTQLSAVDNNGDIIYEVSSEAFLKIGQMPKAQRTREINIIVMNVRDKKWVSVIQTSRQ